MEGILKKELTSVLKYIKSQGVIREMDVRTHFAKSGKSEEHRKILLMLNALYSAGLIEYSVDKRGDNCVRALGLRYQ